MELLGLELPFASAELLGVPYNQMPDERDSAALLTLFLDNF